jgi:hypothetical protein
MLTKANMHALDRLLLERFAGKVGRGLALAFLGVGNTPTGRILFLPWSSPYAATIVKDAPETGIMPGTNKCLG